MYQKVKSDKILKTKCSVSKVKLIQVTVTNTLSFCVDKKGYKEDRKRLIRFLKDPYNKDRGSAIAFTVFRSYNKNKALIPETLELIRTVSYGDFEVKGSWFSGFEYYVKTEDVLDSIFPKV